MDVNITEDLKVTVREVKPRAKETGPRLITKVKATQRIIDWARERDLFKLEEAREALGMKMTCLKTHISFINSNTARFGMVKIVGNRQTKMYGLVSL